MQEWVNVRKSVAVIYGINRIKIKSHMILSIVTEEAFNKIQHPFKIKTLSKLETKGNFST